MQFVLVDLRNGKAYLCDSKKEAYILGKKLYLDQFMVVPVVERDENA